MSSLPNLSSLLLNKEANTALIINFSELCDYEGDGGIPGNPPKPIWQEVPSDQDPDRRVKGDFMLEEFVEGKDVIILQDGHVFKPENLAHWLRTRKTRSNPLNPSYKLTDKELDELVLTSDMVDPNVGDGDRAYTEHWQAYMEDADDDSGDEETYPLRTYYPNYYSLELESGVKLFYEYGSESRIRAEFPNGLYLFYEGARGEEKKVRAEFPSGEKQFFEGDKGQEKRVRVEFPNGLKEFFEGEKGQEKKVRAEFPSGKKQFFEGEKGQEKKVRV